MKIFSQSNMRALQIGVVAFMLFGCSKSVNEEVDFGTFDNSVYQNAYFGFSVTLPKNWSVQDQEAQLRLTKSGGRLVAGDDKNLNAAIKASELQSVHLFAAFQHPVGSPVDFNPSIMCVAERIRDYPGINRGKDYLFQAKKLLEAGQVKVAFPKDYYTETLAGVEFDALDVELTMAKTAIRQKYLVAIQKGYALTFIVSSSNENEATSLSEILRSVKFK